MHDERRLTCCSSARGSVTVNCCAPVDTRTPLGLFNPINNFLARFRTRCWSRQMCSWESWLRCSVLMSNWSTQSVVCYLDEALSYKPKGRGFYSGWGHTIFFLFCLHNPLSRTKVRGFTQSLTETSTGNFLWGGGARPARKTDYLVFICEPIAYRMWEHRRLTTLLASKACYKDGFAELEHTRSGMLFGWYVSVPVSDTPNFCMASIIIHLQLC
jgi:hypothetical protein